MTIEYIDNRNRFFEDVKALGRKNSATLWLCLKVAAVAVHVEVVARTDAGVHVRGGDLPFPVVGCRRFLGGAGWIVFHVGTSGQHRHCHCAAEDGCEFH